jgi:hypothetical protein
MVTVSVLTEFGKLFGLVNQDLWQSAILLLKRVRFWLNDSTHREGHFATRENNSREGYSDPCHE